MTTTTMTDVNKELRESRLRLWKDMQDVLDATAATGMSGEESDKYGRMEADFLRLTQDLEARDRAAMHQARLDEPQKTPDGAADTRTATPYLEEQRSYERAFNKWMRGQADSLTMEERAVLSGGRQEFRDQSVGVGSAGGYLVPEAFANKIFEHRKWFGSMRQVAGQMTTTSGADLIYPNVDDTGNVGAILTENSAISEQDVTFGARTFKAWMYTSKLVQVSWQLMQDSFFDLDTFLARVLGERLGRIENTHMTTGVGATQPEGILTNVTTVAPNTDNTLVLADVVKLIYNVDRAYRDAGVLLMHDLIRLHLRKEASTDGSFIWQPSAQMGEPDRLFGYPVFANNDMDSTVADGKKVVLFGDVRNGYMIRDVKGISLVRLNERYADSLQTGFFAYARLDGQPTYSSTSTQPPYKALIL